MAASALMQSPATSSAWTLPFRRPAHPRLPPPGGPQSLEAPGAFVHFYLTLPCGAQQIPLAFDASFPTSHSLWA